MHTHRIFITATSESWLLENDRFSGYTLLHLSIVVALIRALLAVKKGRMTAPFGGHFPSDASKEYVPVIVNTAGLPFAVIATYIPFVQE